MLITISGLSGSGKSTAAKGLAARLGIPTVDIGRIFRSMAKRYRMDVVAFGAYAERNPEIDRQLDAAMVRRAKKAGSLILQGRLAGWMTHRHGLEAVRVWIAASPRVRARRVALREGIPFSRAYREVARRDRDNLVRYRRTYGLDLNDLGIYDIVVRTDNLTVEEVVSSLLKKLPRIWRMRRKTPLPKRKISSRRHPPRRPRPPRRRPRPRKPRR